MFLCKQNKKINKQNKEINIAKTKRQNFRYGYKIQVMALSFINFEDVLF